MEQSKTTGCAKFLLNGPCGGVRNGLCEVSDSPCVWVQIFNNFKAKNQLDKFLEIRTPKVK